jgi:hypothetical protein
VAADSESKVARVAVDPEDIGIFELARVAVSGGVDDQDLLALEEFFAVEFGVLGDRPRC